MAIKIKYGFQKEYTITPLNHIGTCNNTSFRPAVTVDDINSRFVAENGNDITGDGSLANPYKTINHTLSNLGGRAIITFIRNGMTGKIDSYQNIIISRTLLSSEILIQVEAGEKDIHIHWDNSAKTTNAPNISWAKLHKMKGRERLLAFPTGTNPVYYSDDGKTFISTLPGSYTYADHTDFKNSTAYHVIVGLNEAGTALVYTIDGINYTAITGTNRGYQFVKSTKNYVFAFANDGNCYRSSDGDANYVNIGAPPATLKGVFTNDSNNVYLYACFTDGTIRRTIDGITWENCTAPALNYKQMIYFGDKILALTHTPNAEIYISDDGLSFEPLFTSISEEINALYNLDSDFPNVQNVISFYSQNPSSMILISCIDGTNTKRYLSQDLERFFEWNHESISHHHADDYVQFHENLYAISKNITQNIEYMELSNIINYDDHGLKMDGFHIDGKGLTGNAFYGIYTKPDSTIWGTNNAITCCELRNQLVFSIMLSGVSLNDNIIQNNIIDGKTNIDNILCQCGILDQLWKPISEWGRIEHNIIKNFREMALLVGWKYIIENNVIYNAYTGLTTRRDAVPSTTSQFTNNIFHKCIYDVNNLEVASIPFLGKNLLNGMSINYSSENDIAGINPLFIDEDIEDFRIKTVEKKTEDGKYYPIDSVCKNEYNPAPPPSVPTTTPKDIGVWHERRVLDSTSWQDLILDKVVGSTQIEYNPVDVQSDYSYTGTYLANYKKIMRIFTFNLGDNRQIDYFEIHKLFNILKDKSVKLLLPNDEGLIESGNCSVQGVFISDTTLNLRENELFGKWIKIDDNWNMIKGNSKNQIEIFDNGSMPADGNYNYEIHHGIICYKGFLSHIDGIWSFELRNPTTTNLIKPLLPIDILSGYIIRFRLVSPQSYWIYFRIKSNTENTLILENIYKYAITSNITVQAEGFINRIYIRNEINKLTLKQNHNTDFKDGGAIFGVREGSRNHDYKIDKQTFHESSEITIERDAYV